MPRTAASRVLTELFPTKAALFESIANEQTESQIWGGLNQRADVDAGIALGNQVADSILAIAAQHVSPQTDWGRVAELYGQLGELTPSPVIEMAAFTRPTTSKVGPSSSQGRPPSWPEKICASDSTCCSVVAGSTMKAQRPLPS